MKKVMIIALIIVGMLLIPAAEAAYVLDETVSDYDIFSDSVRQPHTAYYQTCDENYFKIDDISKFPHITYFQISFKGDKLPSGITKDGEYPFNWDMSASTTAPSTLSKTGTMYVARERNILGSVTVTHITMFFYDYSIEGKTGTQNIFISRTFPGLHTGNGGYTIPLENPIGISLWGRLPTTKVGNEYVITVINVNEWKNRVYVTDDITNVYTVNIQRVFDGMAYPSQLKVKNIDSKNSIDEQYYVVKPVENITIIGLDKTYVFPLDGPIIEDPDDPDDPDEDSGLTVYIKNSQTGALIANANVVIDALVDGEYYPVANRTEPSGIFTITLQPTGGGQPNPDGYRLIVTADGYNNPMPVINFTADDYKNYIHCLLDPIAGGPVNENKTFIDFFVRDMSSNPISGATVKFGKYTLITNSAGYTVFEVDKNTNYSWTVSKSGYGTLTGNAVIGNDPRHTINTVLAPIVTPTTTTAIPTSTPISPTPTMTAPTGEPVSNWLEWFAAHFGMILGGGAEIGKIFMWLCFSVPVGVYVGKEAKAGAAGFMAGAGIVTLFFVLIGWVPIWLMVLLALIIGLLYAKVFNNSDNGGGR